MQMVCWTILLALLQVGSGDLPVRDTGDDEVIKELGRRIPSTPGLLSKDMLALMKKASESKRLDALQVLIGCLALNCDPGNSNGEVLSQAEMIPAIELIRSSYGESSLVVLYARGISTDQAWLRERIALAIQRIGNKESIAQLNTLFSVNSPDNKMGRQFAALIDNADLKATLYDPAVEDAARVRKALEKKNKDNQ